MLRLELALSGHELLLALSELALHVGQAVESLGEGIALLLEGLLGVEAFARGAVDRHRLDSGALVAALVLLLVIVAANLAEASDHVLGSHGNLVLGGGAAGLLHAKQALLAGLGIKVVVRGREAVLEDASELIGVELGVEQTQVLLVVVVLVVAVVVVAAPLLEELPEAAVGDVLAAPKAGGDGAPLLGNHLSDLGVEACLLGGVLLHLREGVDDNSEQEVEQDHEHEELEGPEEEGASQALEAREGAELRVDADLSEEDLETGVDGAAEGRERLDVVAENEMGHHGVADEDHAAHEHEMGQIGSSESQGAGDDAETGLEVHELEHTGDQEQNVDAVDGVVPGERVHDALKLAKGVLDHGQALALALTGVSEAQHGRGSREAVVDVVAEVDVEGRRLPQHKDPPHAHGTPHEGDGGQIDPVPDAGEVLGGASGPAPDDNQLLELGEEGGARGDGEEDLQAQADDVRLVRVQLDPDGVELVGDVNGTAVAVLEGDHGGGEDAELRVVSHDLGLDLLGVAIEEQALLHVLVVALSHLLAQVDVEPHGEPVVEVLQPERVEAPGDVALVEQLVAVGRLVGDGAEVHRVGKVVRGAVLAQGEVGAVVVAGHSELVVQVGVVHLGAALEDGVDAKGQHVELASAGVVDVLEAGAGAVGRESAGRVQEHAGDDAVGEANVALTGGVGLRVVVAGDLEAVGHSRVVAGLEVAQGHLLLVLEAVHAGLAPQHEGVSEGDHLLLPSNHDGLELLLHSELNQLLGLGHLRLELLDLGKSGSGLLGSGGSLVLLLDDLCEETLDALLAGLDVLAASVDQVLQGLVGSALLGSLAGADDLLLELGHLLAEAGLPASEGVDVSDELVQELGLGAVGLLEAARGGVLEVDELLVGRDGAGLLGEKAAHVAAVLPAEVTGVGASISEGRLDSLEVGVLGGVLQLRAADLALAVREREGAFALRDVVGGAGALLVGAEAQRRAAVEVDEAQGVGVIKHRDRGGLVLEVGGGFLHDRLGDQDVPAALADVLGGTGGEVLGHVGVGATGPGHVVVARRGPAVGAGVAHGPHVVAHGRDLGESLHEVVHLSDLDDAGLDAVEDHLEGGGLVAEAVPRELEDAGLGEGRLVHRGGVPGTDGLEVEQAQVVQGGQSGVVLGVAASEGVDGADDLRVGLSEDALPVRELRLHVQISEVGAVEDRGQEPGQAPLDGRLGDVGKALAVGGVRLGNSASSKVDLGDVAALERGPVPVHVGDLVAGGAVGARHELHDVHGPSAVRVLERVVGGVELLEHGGIEGALRVESAGGVLGGEEAGVVGVGEVEVLPDHVRVLHVGNGLGLGELSDLKVASSFRGHGANADLPDQGVLLEGLPVPHGSGHLVEDVALHDKDPLAIRDVGNLKVDLTLDSVELPVRSVVAVRAVGGTVARAQVPGSLLHELRGGDAADRMLEVVVQVNHHRGQVLDFNEPTAISTAAEAPITWKLEGRFTYAITTDGVLPDLCERVLEPRKDLI